MMTPFEWVVGDSSKDHTVTALPPTAAQPPRYTTLRGTTPVGGDLSFDESALGPALGCWQSFLLVAFSGSFVHRCRRSPAFGSSGHRLIERGSGRGSSVILSAAGSSQSRYVGGGGTSHEVGER